MPIRPPSGKSVRISPRAPILPANTLRFYLHFPRPGEAHFDRARLRLVDEGGLAVPDPFLVLSQELWSLDGRRLTVLMEPGRIKRGMGADLSHSPALEVGRSYSLELDVLDRTARYTFGVGEPVARPLDEVLWRVTPPRAGGADPVMICFDRVMDDALVEDEIVVLGPSGTVVSTDATLEPCGMVARLTPHHPWRTGAHRIVLSTRFEDTCGNRLGEALDHHLSDKGCPREGTLAFSPAPLEVRYEAAPVMPVAAEAWP